MSSFIKAEADEMCEEFEFDKFMDDIMLKEGRKTGSKKLITESEDSLGKRYALKYGEKPGNRIRFR